MANFVTRDNADFIDQLYRSYEQNPESVSLEWRKFFEGVDFATKGSFPIGEQSSSGEQNSSKAMGKSGASSSATQAETSSSTDANTDANTELAVFQLIEAYRNFGHFEADLDPLANSVAPSEQLQLARFGLSEKHLGEKFRAAAIVGKPQATLAEVVQHLRQTYCGKISVQCADALPDVRDWFIAEFEQKSSATAATPTEKKSILEALSRAEGLEKFLHTRYVGAKRFSIEGADNMLPMLTRMTEAMPGLGASEMVIGMAHRGRVNVLANFMGKPVQYIFADFNGPTETAVPMEDFDGDVKYHLGYEAERTTASGAKVRLHLAFNPSHLEAVNPVVTGVTRALQRLRQDHHHRKQVIPILIHGDAAFAGQGVVFETLQMSQVQGYRVGGTIHICIDNQVGFTTSPESARSAHYSTDVAKALGIPVLHVNGDDAEACVRAALIALRFRQEWARDIVINLVCYRRYGHNEGDEPAYTQPLMYDIIRKHPTPRELYGKKLIAEATLNAAQVEAALTTVTDELQGIYEATKKQAPKILPFAFKGPWEGLRKARAEDFEKTWDTKTPMANLQKLGQVLSQPPTGFQVHPKLQKLLEARKNAALGSEKMDWGTAEMFAYGSLLLEGFSVRISGQDCIRGTFTHRHAGFFDHRTGEAWLPLKSIQPEKSHFCIYNSILSEYAVMGFEYGNSITDPNFLTIWEAQFGDFGNGAQIMLDQFLSAAESKWQQMSGLVLLLPHGYEGQGPEHSSGRMERFLQMSAQLNWQVVNLTTPAQIYHALRRQVKRPFRKPLVVLSPKSLLRHPKAVSGIDELAGGQFHEVLGDANLDAESLLLCSGKIYYELLEEREKLGSQRTAIVRVEQLYPTPTAAIAKQILSRKKLRQIAWVQEEPKNMGAYQSLYFAIAELLQKEKLGHLSFSYIGRGERSSPATGSPYRHKTEQAEILRRALTF